MKKGAKPVLLYLIIMLSGLIAAVLFVTFKDGPGDVPEQADKRGSKTAPKEKSQAVIIPWGAETFGVTPDAAEKLAKKISVRFENAELREVAKSLRESSGLNLILLPLAEKDGGGKKISLELNNKPVRIVLDYVAHQLGGGARWNYFAGAAVIGTYEEVFETRYKIEYDLDRYFTGLDAVKKKALGESIRRLLAFGSGRPLDTGGSSFEHYCDGGENRLVLVQDYNVICVFGRLLRAFTAPVRLDPGDMPAPYEADPDDEALGMIVFSAYDFKDSGIPAGRLDELAKKCFGQYASSEYCYAIQGRIMVVAGAVETIKSFERNLYRESK